MLTSRYSTKSATCVNDELVTWSSRGAVGVRTRHVADPAGELSAPLLVELDEPVEPRGSVKAQLDACIESFTDRLGYLTAEARMVGGEAGEHEATSPAVKVIAESSA